MTIYTRCGHCGKAISFDLPKKDVSAEAGKIKGICKVQCQRCEQISDVMITILPTGEQQ